MIDEHTTSLQPPAGYRPHRIRLPRVVAWLTIAAAICVALGLLIWMGQMKHCNESQRQTKMRFHDIWASLEWYTSGFDHLPYLVRRAPMQLPEMYWRNGEGNPLYSWRVELVPGLVSWHGTWDNSQPWDSPANKELLELSPYYSYDESFFSKKAREVPNDFFSEANTLAISGPGTAFGDGAEQPKSLKETPPAEILVVEVRSSGIPWPAPGDFDIRTMPHKINAPDGKGISSRYPGGFHVLFADGKVWFLSDKIPFDTLAHFFTIDGASKHDREKELGPYALDRDP